MMGTGGFEIPQHLVDSLNGSAGMPLSSEVVAIGEIRCILGVVDSIPTSHIPHFLTNMMQSVAVNNLACIATLQKKITETEAELALLKAEVAAASPPTKVDVITQTRRLKMKSMGSQSCGPDAPVAVSTGTQTIEVAAPVRKSQSPPPKKPRKKAKSPSSEEDALFKMMTDVKGHVDEFASSGKVAVEKFDKDVVKIGQVVGIAADVVRGVSQLAARLIDTAHVDSDQLLKLVRREGMKAADPVGTGNIKELMLAEETISANSAFFKVSSGMLAGTAKVLDVLGAILMGGGVPEVIDDREHNDKLLHCVIAAAHDGTWKVPGIGDWINLLQLAHQFETYMYHSFVKEFLQERVINPKANESEQSSCQAVTTAARALGVRQRTCDLADHVKIAKRISDMLQSRI